jgi:hypothetical protein
MGSGTRAGAWLAQVDEGLVIKARLGRVAIGEIRRRDRVGAGGTPDSRGELVDLGPQLDGHA